MNTLDISEVLKMLFFKPDIHAKNNIDAVEVVVADKYEAGVTR